MTASVQLNRIQTIVLDAIRNANLAREQSEQLEVSADAPLFGPDSPLDSLGLLALLMDIEDSLLADGYDVMLSTEHAMSQTKSPFSDVPALVAYIEQLLLEKA